jgi:DNA polymerase I-like protein with 3'-5' exonuclease and polymerase domains
LIKQGVYVLCTIVCLQGSAADLIKLAMCAWEEWVEQPQQQQMWQSMQPQQHQQQQAGRAQFKQQQQPHSSSNGQPAARLIAQIHGESG